METQVSETRKKVIGIKHPNTLIGMAHLAMTYRNRGRWEEAEECKQQNSRYPRGYLGRSILKR